MLYGVSYSDARAYNIQEWAGENLLELEVVVLRQLGMQGIDERDAGVGAGVVGEVTELLIGVVLLDEGRVHLGAVPARRQKLPGHDLVVQR